MSEHLYTAPVASLAWLTEHLHALSAPLIAMRRQLHRIPETAWTEYRTACYIAEKLQQWGWQLTLGEDALCRAARMGLPDPHYQQQVIARAVKEGLSEQWLSIFADGMTGIWADLHLGPADNNAPLVAIRADMDALSIQEAQDTTHIPTREGFASLHAGLMHACGHDGHMAILLSLAHLLTQCAAFFPHSLHVRLLFQPAEEGVRGATAMLQAGALENVDFLLGLHIGLSAATTGMLVCGVENFLATTKLDAHFTGQAAHAASAPQDGRNALLAASAAALGLHAISRHSDAPTRVCAGILRAGENRNSIPAHAVLELEVRATTSTAQCWLEDETQRVINAAAQLWNCTSDVATTGRAPAGSSHPALRERIMHCATDLPTFSHVIPTCTFGASEDFSTMLEAVHASGGQAAYLLAGSNLAAGHHTPYFDFDESVLLPTIELLARLCLDIAKHP